ncbi:MAG: ATP-binding cassette domain-containing protein [Nitratireductor sp.]
MATLLELDNVCALAALLPPMACHSMSKRASRLPRIGPNGAGKTTIFSLVMGEIRQNSGAIRFKGHDISALPTHERIKRGISRTYQVPRPLVTWMLRRISVSG